MENVLHGKERLQNSIFGNWKAVIDKTEVGKTTYSSGLGRRISRSQLSTH